MENVPVFGTTAVWSWKNRLGLFHDYYLGDFDICFSGFKEPLKIREV